MTRRCSHCSNNGHNSRTCPTRGGGGGGLRLFGVRLTEGVGAMKKSASMGCLSSAALAGASPSGDSPGAGASRASGYASDDPAHASCSSSRSERKKGTPWTEEEHRMFLLGLKKLGKGDWRGIAKNFVVSRTPTQVASHAQKYFIRQCNTSRRKRRSSLFDMVPEMPMEQAPFHEEQHLPCPPNDPENMNELPSLHLSLQQGPEVIKSSKTNHITELGESIPYNKNASIALMPTFYPAFIPVTLPFWPANLPTAVKDAEMRETYEIVKPTPVVTKDLENVDEVGMSKLSIGEDSASRMEPTLSLKLQGATSSRQSAFHSNPSIAGPDLNQSSSSPIHAL